MQTHDAVEDLYHYREFFELSVCSEEAMETQKNVLHCFHKIFIVNDSTNEGKMMFIYFLIEIGFLDTRSSFLPVNQNAHPF